MEYKHPRQILGFQDLIYLKGGNTFAPPPKIPMTPTPYILRLRLSLHKSQVAHQVGAYPGFLSMKRLGVFLLPPGWDASPSQGYPPALNSSAPIYTPGWREAL